MQQQLREHETIEEIKAEYHSAPGSAVLCPFCQQAKLAQGPDRFFCSCGAALNNAPGLPMTALNMRLGQAVAEHRQSCGEDPSFHVDNSVSLVVCALEALTFVSANL